MFHEFDDEDIMSVLLRLQLSRPRSRTSSRASAVELPSAAQEALSRISLINNVVGLRPHATLNFTLDTEVGFGGQNLTQTDRQVQSTSYLIGVRIILFILSSPIAYRHCEGSSQVSWRCIAPNYTTYDGSSDKVP